MRANLDVKVGRPSFGGNFQQIIDVHGSPRGTQRKTTILKEIGCIRAPGVGRALGHARDRFGIESPPMHTDLSLQYLLHVPSGRADAEAMPMVVLIHGRKTRLRRSRADARSAIQARFVFQTPRPPEAYPGTTFGWTWFEGWPPERSSVAASARCC
jgi:hypothetical protein